MKRRGGADGILNAGEIVDGIYEVTGLLGEGGMARVYEAFDRSLSRTVALKIARETTGPGRSPLHLEAQALAAAHHPSLVSIHAMGVHRGCEYLVLERIYGKSLDAHLRMRAAAGTRFSIDEAIDILIAVADGLAAVHRAGGAHRDLKPANVMLAPGNRVVLMDLGIFQPESAETPRCAAGTPQYMAPEAFAVDVELGTWRLVDLYALGVMAYELVTGQRPYEGTGADALFYKHTWDPVPDPGEGRGDVPRRLARLISELMAKEPENRPIDAESVARELREIRRRADARPHAEPLVLIVDDDPDALALLRATVAHALPRARIRTARSAEDALTMIAREVPALLVLDLLLPRMSGIEMLMYLRGKGEADSCSVITASGNSTAADDALLGYLGVTHRLVKGPDLRRRLADAVAQVCRRAPA